MQRILFVVNPVSGMRSGKQNIVQLIRDTMRYAGLNYDIAFTAGRGDGIRLSQQAAAEGFAIVAAVGGDGTVNEVGQGLMGSTTALAVIPAGSGNGFARNFNIPLNHGDALHRVLNPKIIPIDAGIINNHYFFNVAGIGLDATICKNFEGSGVRGILSYFLVGAKTFFTYKPIPIRIKFKNREINTAPLMVSIANAPQYGSGAIIAPHARPDDGLLDVCFIEKPSFLKALTNFPRLFDGTIDQMNGYHSFQTSTLTIECPEPCLIHTDGDPHQEEAILKIEILPGKLKVVVGDEKNKACTIKAAH